METHLNKYIRSLELAEAQFKLALHANSAAHFGSMPQPCIGFQWGELTAGSDYLKLETEDLETAGSVLIHSATYLVAVTIDTALTEVFPRRFDSKDEEIVLASRIANVIRNAFAHNPVFRKWDFRNRRNIGRFVLPDVILLDTTNLDGKRVEREHYGGPLALLRLLHFTRDLLRNEQNEESSP